MTSNLKDIELDIFLLVAATDPVAPNVLDLYPHFLKVCDFTTFREAIDELLLKGDLSMTGWRGNYLKLSDKGRKKIQDLVVTSVVDAQGAESVSRNTGSALQEKIDDPLQELLLLVDFMEKKHTAKTEYVN